MGTPELEGTYLTLPARGDGSPDSTTSRSRGDNKKYCGGQDGGRMKMAKFRKEVARALMKEKQS